MRWMGRRASANVEDRRGLGGMAMGGGAGTILLLLVAYFFGIDPGAIPVPSPRSQVSRPASQEEEQLKQFVSVVLADTEDVWNQKFQEMGRDYREPTLVLFSGQVQSGCGFASAAVGPFYCGEDHKLYIDLGFYGELRERFGAPGDFAQAYVIAHEVGHHVQNLMGTLDQVHSAQRRMGKAEANALLTRLELQADFYAGVWGHYAQKRGLVEPGDMEEALRAAHSLGDDKLQLEAQGYVVPDSFTHGTSEQRMRWFRKGMQTGDLRQGNTFETNDL